MIHSERAFYCIMGVRSCKLIDFCVVDSVTSGLLFVKVGLGRSFHLKCNRHVAK